MKQPLQVNLRHKYLLKTKKTIFFIMLTTSTLSTSAQVKDYATDPNLSIKTKDFLKLINIGGPGLETLSPADARMVLVNAQKSVTVDLSGIDESEKTISAGGYSIKLNIVRPAGVTTKLPVFIF